jgi:hypothetical protein
MKISEVFVIGQCGGDEEDGVGSVGSGFVDLDSSMMKSFLSKRQVMSDGET